MASTVTPGIAAPVLSRTVPEARVVVTSVCACAGRATSARAAAASSAANPLRAPDELSFEVTRCAYVETYREMGLPEELVGLVSCCRDEPFATAYSPHIVMERPETIGQGAARCRFRFTWKD